MSLVIHTADGNQALAQTEESQPGDLLTAIARAAADPRVDAEKMRQLYALHKEMLADQRKVAFDAALSQLQAELPQIEKYGKGKNSKYAKYEDIDVIIKPFTSKYGFAFSFNEESRDDKAKTVTFVCVLSHKDGHREPKRLTVSIDEASTNREGKSIRPAIQDDGSTAAYARRYLKAMHLDLVFKDEDTDGDRGNEPCAADNVKDMEIMIADTRTDMARFLDFMGVDKLQDIRKNELRKAFNALEAKAKANRK